ncbi:hypothetical protein J1N35_011875 [Gossypium stocksii]|uniref:DUF4219 domain-containing protein n=1 Tax=Gossypium stocksii TaxID=47602 RepID=A0A9D3W4G9_9ROSI|nr:hypothetical protein J1N35_011875 [Gossypium stocksii]
MGDLHYFLGIEVTRSSTGNRHLCQHKYIKDIPNRSSLTSAKSVHTLMFKGDKIPSLVDKPRLCDLSVIIGLDTHAGFTSTTKDRSRHVLYGWEAAKDQAVVISSDEVHAAVEVDAASQILSGPVISSFLKTMSSSSFSPVAPPVFNGEIYHIWVVKIKTYLQAFDLWEVVNSNVEPAPLRANPTVAQIRQHADERTKRHKAMLCIQNSMFDLIS